MKITGYYNKSGYQVETDNPMDGIIYRAENHALDSRQSGTRTEFQLLLDRIKYYCEQTTAEIAVEKNAEYCGVEYLED